MKNPHGGGGGDEQGNDQTVPENQSKDPPQGFLVTELDLRAVTELGGGDIIAPLESVIRSLLPTVEVRASEDLRRFGFWLTPSGDAHTAAARDRALDDITTRASESFLLSITPAMFFAITQRYWHDMQKRFGDYTTITLDRFDAGLVAPNELVVDVHGTVIMKVGDILPVSPGFDYTQKCVLFASHGRLVSTAFSTLHADPSCLDWLKDLLGITAGDKVPNIGAMVADRLPSQILLPGLKLKFVLLYHSIRTSPETGILVGISHETVARNARIELHPIHATVGADATSVRVEVGYVTHDFRNPHVEWHTEGHVEPHGHGAIITFPLPVPHPHAMSRIVRVIATDADGGRDEGKAEVQISTAADPSEPPRGAHRLDR